MRFVRCGHDRNPENVVCGQCRTCRDERLAAKMQITADRNARIVYAYNAGDSLEVLCARYRFSRSHIRTILREANIKAEGQYRLDPTFHDRALKVAADLAGANVKQLTSEWRAPKVLVHARWAVMTAMHRRGVSYPRIGARLRRDHSTVIYGIREAKALAERSPEFAQLLERVDAA